MLAYITALPDWAYMPADKTAPASRAGIAAHGRRVSANAVVTKSTEATISHGPERTSPPSTPPGVAVPVPVPVMAAMLAAAAEPPTPTATRIIDTAQAAEPIAPSVPAAKRPARRPTSWSWLIARVGWLVIAAVLHA